MAAAEHLRARHGLRALPITWWISRSDDAGGRPVAGHPAWAMCLGVALPLAGAGAIAVGAMALINSVYDIPPKDLMTAGELAQLPCRRAGRGRHPRPRPAPTAMTTPVAWELARSGHLVPSLRLAPIAVSTAAAAAFLAARHGDTHDAIKDLRVPGLLLALGSGYVLDDGAAVTLQASPYTLGRRIWLRIGCAAAVVVPLWTAMLARFLPSAPAGHRWAPGLGLTVELGAALTLIWAVAAWGHRHGFEPRTAHQISGKVPIPLVAKRVEYRQASHAPAVRTPPRELVMSDLTPLPTFPFESPRSLEPAPELFQLQADEPVTQVQLPGGDEAYIVTRYEDVRTALYDTRFSRAAGSTPGMPTLNPGAQGIQAMFNMDPPDHTRLRGLVSRAFTVRSVERMRPRVAAIVAELVDAMVGQGPPADLVTGLAAPMPATVICAMLGIPLDERTVMYDWVRTTLTYEAPPPEEVARVTAKAGEYLFGLIDRRREHPEDDLLTALVQVHDDNGDRLTQDELLGTVLLLFGTGQHTTSHHLAMSVLALFRHPGEWARLAEAPDRVPVVVEELLRVIPLVEAVSSRVARVDVELSGVTVPAGASVFPVINMANRDPSVFTDSGRFDTDRTDVNRHLAFGHGAHFCLGASLARLELQTALTALVTRLPKLRLAVAESELAWHTDGMIRGLRALPVAW
jgi:cytochrome P450